MCRTLWVLHIMTLVTVQGFHSRRRPSSLYVAIRFSNGWWVMPITSFSWTCGGRHTLPRSICFLSSHLPPSVTDPRQRQNTWRTSRDWQSRAYGQRFVQLPRPVVETVEHQVFSHTVNPLPPRWQRATHKVSSFLSVCPESLHNLRRTRGGN